MGKKNFAIAGMVIGVVIFILGFIVCTGGFGGDASHAGSAPAIYDSGYATFGADFYNYVANNAGEAASASRTAADNLFEIAKLLKGACGLLLMGFGLFGLCHFGMAYSECSGAAVKLDDSTEKTEPEQETAQTSNEPEETQNTDAQTEQAELDSEKETANQETANQGTDSVFFE